MLKYFERKKQKQDQAEQKVWDYIHICEAADEELNRFSEQERICGTATLKSAEHRSKIDAAFTEMKCAVDKCPRKFRDKMAMRLTLSNCI